MSDGAATLRHLSRAVERRWSELAGGPVVLSPRDFRVLADWHDRGVPLALILEALDAACERRRDGGAPRRLAAIAPAVEEGWRTVIDGRLEPASPASPAAAGPAADRNAPIELWRRCAASPSTPAALRELIDSLLAHLDRRERTAAELDAELDAALERTLDAAGDRELVAAVDERLDAHRERMSRAELADARRRALAVARRRSLGLPRLSARDATGDC